MNQVLGISMKQICLSLSDVAACLQRTLLVDELGWKPLSSISPLTASRLVSSKGVAVVICISIKMMLRKKNWAFWWGIFCYWCYHYFVNIVFLYLHELVFLGTLCFSSCCCCCFICDLSFHKEFVIYYIFYILKLNLISFFGIAIISTSTKNKLIIIILTWNNE